MTSTKTAEKQENVIIVPETRQDRPQSLTTTGADPAANMLAVIQRAATDPSVDLDKMERLMGMYERIETKRAEQAYNEAMSAAQAEMRPVARDATNPQTQSKYSTYAKLDNALRPIYTAHGFALSFDEGEAPKENYVRILCYVSHTAGFSRTYHVDMPADGKGARGGDVMTKTHATDSAFSYGMRRLLRLIFNVATGEGDDDGNAAGGEQLETITESQAADLDSRLEELGVDKDAFKRWAKVSTLDQILAKNFKRVCEALEQRARESEKA